MTPQNDDSPSIGYGEAMAVAVETVAAMLCIGMTADLILMRVLTWL